MHGCPLPHLGTRLRGSLGHYEKFWTDGGYNIIILSAGKRIVSVSPVCRGVDPELVRVTNNTGVLVGFLIQRKRTIWFRNAMR